MAIPQPGVTKGLALAWLNSIMPAGKTAGNHAWDCACMGVILAVRWGIIGRDVSDEERPRDQDEGGLTQATDGAG